MCQTCQDISPLSFPHHHIYIWFNFLSQLLAKIQNLIPINEKWRRIKIIKYECKCKVANSFDLFYQIIEEDVKLNFIEFNGFLDK